MVPVCQALYRNRGTCYTSIHNKSNIDGVSWRGEATFRSGERTDPRGACDWLFLSLFAVLRVFIWYVGGAHGTHSAFPLGSTPGYEGPGEGDENISRKPGNVLKTLDPILITIIAMSALGVLLGAVCGVVLYCACWHNGMSERNLSALENYNFELVDGVKLKKDKLNTQSTYSEA